MSGENYPADWDKRRRQVFKRDAFECRGCGVSTSDAGGVTLHCHHSTPISEGGGHGLDNLMAVCESCHQEIHSSQQTPPLEPIQYYECSWCDGEYVDGGAYRGSFCSERCYTEHRARKILNMVENDGRICSTCYANFSPRKEICPNCGNWDSQQDNSHAIDEFDTDVINLIAALVKKTGL